MQGHKSKTGEVGRLFENITIGRFIPTGSVVHRLDPRTKLFLTFAYTSSVFLIKSPAAFAFNLLAVIVAYKLAKIPIKMLIKNLRAVLPLLLIVAAINLFLVPGDIVFRVWGLKATKQGAVMVGFMMLRITCLISSLGLLTYTTSPSALTGAIEKFLKPLLLFRISPGEVALMLNIALRFVPTLLQEAKKVADAQKARGAQFESKRLKPKLKAFVSVFVPLIYLVIKRAEDLADAMESRCYNGAEGRSRFRVLEYTKLDAYALVGFLAYAFCLFMLNRTESL